MTVQIARLSQKFQVIGDGAATEARLSTFDYPFPQDVEGIVASVRGGDTSFDPNRITSVALDGTDVVLAFASAFTGLSGTFDLYLGYNLPN